MIKVVRVAMFLVLLSRLNKKGLISIKPILNLYVVQFATLT